MKLLLDTHILLWWLEDDKRLPQTDRDAIALPEHEIYVSAASGYEVALKAARKKIDWDVNELRIAIGLEGFQILDINWRHMAVAGAFPLTTNKDPWDRLLAAQSILEFMPLVTNDEKLKILFSEAKAQLGLA